MQSNFCRQGYCIPLGWCHSQRSAVPDRDGLWRMGNDSAYGSWQMFSHFSCYSHQPHSPQVCLVHSFFPLLESRVSGCKQNVVLWPFKRLSHLQLSLPHQQNPWCSSHLDVMWVPFWLWFCRLRDPAWGLDTTFLRGNTLPGHWHIPLAL